MSLPRVLTTSSWEHPAMLLAGPSPCVLSHHQEKPLGCTSAGRSWAQGWSGREETQAGMKHRQGKCRQESRQHHGLTGAALWVALLAPSHSSALGLPPLRGDRIPGAPTATP